MFIHRDRKLVKCCLRLLVHEVEVLEVGLIPSATAVQCTTVVSQIAMDEIYMSLSLCL